MQVAVEQSLPGLIPSDIPQVTLEIPGDKKHGEYSCNIALRLTKSLKKDPFSIAAQLKTLIEKNIQSGPLKDKIKAIEAVKPGFINFFLTNEAFYDILYEAEPVRGVQ